MRTFEGLYLSLLNQPAVHVCVHLDKALNRSWDCGSFDFYNLSFRAPKIEDNSMRFQLVVIISLAGISVNATASAPELNGNWTVDLSVEPDKPYTKPMVLDLKSDGSVEGSFYESKIESGRWKVDRGRTCVSFRTSDGNGPYHSAACLNGNNVQGQTWAEHRNFLFNWTAVR